MKFILSLVLLCFSFGILAQSDDWRLISNGNKIYEHGYCDQPYIVTAKDGTWVCTFTTSPGQEGDQIQYIVSSYSKDQGKTWSEPVEIEPAAANIEASWAMPLITSYDRVYVFYTYNGDAVRSLPDGKKMRSDTHGWYCYKYSDDKGVTWSKRYRLNMRKTPVDLNNDFSGEVQMFWGIGKPVSKRNNVWFSYTKLGKYFLEQSEGWLFYSDNILTERNVSNINWTMLPEGDHGIRGVKLGSVQEEFNVQPMNQENGLYCVYRTTLGQPAHTYSYDNGKSWTEPELMTYEPGLPLRNPRACSRLWKCKNGKYLLWHHNNGGKSFQNRNPAWVSGGIEKDGKIVWSQPEIVLYGPDHSYATGRFSYPDLVEQDGKYWISTTQKTSATIHEVPAVFFEKLWGQFEGSAVDEVGLIGTYDNISGNQNIEFSKGIKAQVDGLALDFWIKVDKYKNSAILESTGENGNEIRLNIKSDKTLEFLLFNEQDTAILTSDLGRLTVGNYHHISILLDTKAEITYMLIDGSISDGGGQSVFGFDRLDQGLLDLKFKGINFNKFDGQLDKLKVYDQSLFTSRFVNNYKAEKPGY